MKASTNLLWNTNNIKLTKAARIKGKVDNLKLELASLKAVEPVIETLLGNKLCRNISIRSFFTQSGKWLTLQIYNVDMPTVIDHVCAPIHQKYGCDWICSVNEYNINLEAKITKDNKKVCDCWSHLCLACINIQIYEEEMKSCQIVKVKIGEKTQEEMQAALLVAAERDRFEHRIDCSEGGGE